MKIDSPTFVSETQFISASVVYSSGSQKFGNTEDDQHTFVGSITASGNIELTGANKKISGSATSTGSFGRVNVNGSGTRMVFNTGTTDGTIDFLAIDDGSTVSKMQLFSQDVGGSTGINMMTDGNFAVSKLNNTTFFKITENSGIVEFPAANQKISGSSTSTGSFGKLELRTQGTTNPVLTLGDLGVVDYNYSFPDAFTLKLEIASAAERTFQLNNSAAGKFNFSTDGGVTVGTHITSSGHIISSKAHGLISGSSTSTGSFGRLNATTVSASNYVGQIGSRHIHAQTSNSATWTVNHNLGHKYPVVTVYDSDDQIIQPASGYATDTATFTLSFNEAIQGTAVVSIGGIGTNSGQAYVHSQGVSSTNWRVTHSLSEQYPNVTIYDGNNEVIIPESITATGINHTDIQFSSVQSGYANFSIGGGIPNISVGNAGKFLKVRADGQGVEWVPTTANVSGSMSVSGSILPNADNTFDLGSEAKRWANLYTGDVQLSNEGSEGNEVDGTTGKWTIQEGEDDLYLLNRKNGKKYRFKLQEIK